MTQDMNTLEVLMKARALIAGGWCRRSYQDGRGGYCIRGAIHTAEGDCIPQPGWQWQYIPPETEAVKAIRRALPEGYIVAFNDAPYTTQAHVLARFDRAIEAEWEKVQGAAEPVEAVPA